MVSRLPQLDDFIIAEIKVSFCGAVDIGENRAVLSTFITDPTCRGRGIGSLVLKKVMEIFQVLIVVKIFCFLF